MNSTSRLASSPKPRALPWVVALVVSTIFLGVLDYARSKRIVHVTRAHIADEPALDAASPSGYMSGKRWLIVPEHHNPTYQWIQETQQMFARDEWRVRRIDYENAPEGREVRTASPYHWWIASIAWSQHRLTGKPLGWCVEQAAFWAGPLLHLALSLSTVVFVARVFGAGAAIFLALGLTTLYPFAASFLPGILSEHNVAQVVLFWSMLLAVAGIYDESRTNRWWLLSGIGSGCGFWMSATLAWPVVAGMILGGILVATARTMNPTSPRKIIPWRFWGIGAATASLLGYAVEYYPDHMDLRLEVNHPLYAFACLGIAELLYLSELSAQRRKFPVRAREIAGAAFGAIAVAALPSVMLWKHTFPAQDPFAERLSNEPDGVVASNVASWLVRSDVDGIRFAATLLPLLLLVPAFWMLARHANKLTVIPAVLLVLGVTSVLIPLAFAQLGWWSLATGMLLLFGVVFQCVPRARTLVFGAAGIAFFSGILQLVHAYSSLSEDSFTQREVEQIYERTLAHWIADHAGPGGARVVAPSFCTPSLNFYGGLSGLGTRNWENREGLATALRIASITEVGEAQGFLDERGVTHVILPSWNRELQEFARLSVPDEKRSFVYQLEHWTVLDWIRPLPFRLPEIGGMAEPAVGVFQVTSASNRAVAISRLTEYFVEMERIDMARLGLPALREYPYDLGALVAIAQVEKAGGDEEAFRRTFETLVANVEKTPNRFLPWNVRINLAVILTLGGRKDLAQPQVKRCWEEMTAARLRSLTTAELYRFLVLGKNSQLSFIDPDLESLAHRLLPPHVRSRF